jgi:hypothetical protein
MEIFFNMLSNGSDLTSIYHVNTMLLGPCCRVKYEEIPSDHADDVHLLVIRILLAAADNYSTLHLPETILSLLPITRILLVARQGCYKLF